MREFFDAGTAYDPRVSYSSENQVFTISGTSNCKEPTEFFTKHRDLLCEDVRENVGSGISLKLALEFVSSGTLTALEHLLNDLSNEANMAGWLKKIELKFLEFSEPTVEDALKILRKSAAGWSHISLIVVPADED